MLLKVFVAIFYVLMYFAVLAADCDFTAGPQSCCPATLGSVTIADTVIVIPTNAFINCVNLTSITIPSSVTATGFAVFQGCTNLTSITLPNLLAGTINNNLNVFVGSPFETATFSTCPYSTYASSVTYTAPVGSPIFVNPTCPVANCDLSAGSQSCCPTSPGSVIIASTVTSIPTNAFINCVTLTSIAIPSSVTATGDSVFNGCTNLRSITLSNLLADSFTSVCRLPL